MKSETKVSRQWKNHLSGTPEQFVTNHDKKFYIPIFCFNLRPLRACVYFCTLDKYNQWAVQDPIHSSW